MSETPETNNRLKSAVNSVSVPADLAARIHDQIHAEQLQSDVNARVKGAVGNVPVPPFLEARIRRNQGRRGRVRKFDVPGSSQHGSLEATG